MFLWRNVTPKLMRFQKIPLMLSVRDSSGCEEEITFEERIRARIGNREIVAYGLNGSPSYIDLNYCPCPSIRFREFGPELMVFH